MLSKDSSAVAHFSQNASLILLSILMFPVDTIILVLSFILRPSLAPNHSSEKLREIRSASPFRQRTILVTGVGMTKGLCLARHFHTAGHRVIGADFEPSGALASGRFSRALNAFYRLPQPDQSSGTSGDRYIEALVRTITQERVDLWVSCSGVASAVTDGLAAEVVQRSTTCKAIQFTAANTATLHEKHTFIAHVSALGLRVPETHVLKSADEARPIFAAAGSKRFILKPIGMDDSHRGDMTLLPRPTTSETSIALARVPASATNPWILQQFVAGREYCTHALVVRGRVKIFVACPSSELLMHYEALLEESPLSRAMLAFTCKVAEAGGEEFTGHLSFDFLVEARDGNKTNPDDIALWPIECNPRAHTAVVLFNDTPGLVDAYLSLLDNPPTSTASDMNAIVLTPMHPAKYHWAGHDFVNCLILTLGDCFGKGGSVSDWMDGVRDFRHYMLEWKDGTFEVWDPVPWWWLYHGYWPVRFFNAIVNCRWWSRINVSTTKMFGC